MSKRLVNKFSIILWQVQKHVFDVYCKFTFRWIFNFPMNQHALQLVGCSVGRSSYSDKDSRKGREVTLPMPYWVKGFCNIFNLYLLGCILPLHVQLPRQGERIIFWQNDAAAFFYNMAIRFLMMIKCARLKGLLEAFISNEKF